MTFPLRGNDSKSLVVRIQSISATETLTNNVMLLSTGVTALIDSTLSFIWLPLSVCQAFEQAFGLTWNASKELYLVNNTVHRQLLSKNPSVTFTLGNLTSEHGSVNITLPYGAFDLQASSPIFPNGTNYFPLRRASNAQQYTLGRAFLQEAYLLVDYEQSNFSVSQAQFLGNNNSNIITIDHSDKLSTTNTTASSGQPSHHLNRAALAGVVAGPSIAIIALCTLAFFVFRAFRRRPASHDYDKSISSTSPIEKKDNWPSSPSNSSNVPNQHILQAIVSADSESSLNKAHMIGELEDIQNVPPGAPRAVVPPWAKSRQELAGCNASKELPQTPLPSRPRTPTGRAKHIHEIAADEHWIAQYKR